MRAQKWGRRGKGDLCWKKRFKWKATSCLWNYIIILVFFNFCDFIQLHFHYLQCINIGFNYQYFFFNAFTLSLMPSPMCALYFVFTYSWPTMHTVCTWDWEYRETILTCFITPYCGFTSENLERMWRSYVSEITPYCEIPVSYVQRFP